MSSPWYSAAQLAAMKLPGLPANERRMRDRVNKEKWASRQVPSKGGKSGMRTEYQPPKAVLKMIEARGKQIERHNRIAEDGTEAQVIAKLRAEGRAAKAIKTQASLDQIYAALSPEGIAKFDAHFDIVLAFREYFKSHNENGQHLRRNEAFIAFAEDYNGKRIKVSDDARAKYTRISPRSNTVRKAGRVRLCLCPTKNLISSSSAMDTCCTKRNNQHAATRWSPWGWELEALAEAAAPMGSVTGCQYLTPERKEKQ